MSCSPPPPSDCDIDPTVLADVTRVVQELMRLQLQQEQEERELHKAHHHHDPLDGISTVSRELDGANALENADRQGVQVTLMSVHDSLTEEQQLLLLQQQEQHELQETVEQIVEDEDIPSSPILLLSSCSSVSSLSSYNTAPILADVSATYSQEPLPLSSPQLQAEAFRLEDSAIEPQDTNTSKSLQPSLLLSLPEGSTTSGLEQAYNNLPPGQKTPTRSTKSVIDPSSNPEEESHQYFSHPPPTTQKNNDTKNTWTATSELAEEQASQTLTEIGGYNNSGSDNYPGLNSDYDIKNIIQEIKEANTLYQSAEAAITTVIPRTVPTPTRPHRKKALLIGINYFGDPNQLLGCINDSRDVFGFLNGYYGFRYQDTIILTDDQIYEDKRPTGANIRYWMKWLVKDAEPQDSLFFHYAGHGGRIKDFSYNGKAEHLGDEADGYDEIIYPCDYLRSGIISDDEMYDILVKELPAGVQLTALVDACHSGTMLDLPYVYNGNHITALEKVTRTKVGAMAAMSSGVLDNNSSTNLQQQTQTQTTTTTTTTTLTTVTTTTKSCPSSPLIMATDPEHPHNNSPVCMLDLETACSKAYLSPMSPSIENMTVNVQLIQEPAPGRPLSPATIISALTPPISTATSTTRSMLDTDETPDGEECIPRLTITHADEHKHDSVSTFAFSEEGLTENTTSEGELASSPKKRAKSVRGDDFDADQDVSGRGIECDASAWLGAESLTPAPASASTISITSTATSSKNGSRNHSRTSSEMDRADLEEAKRMAMFRKTKGNVVMFSGCRDDQASADIRASTKDAAIISNHHKLKASSSMNSLSSNDLDENGIPNPLGYSLPQPYTSPMARGAVSYAWIQCLSQKPEQTYEELLTSMRYFMKQRDLEQIPQLGSGMPMDMRTVFTL
ncbi:metacaspase-1 [Entomortierella parvispora]|uniref:Metacaspase-1 n=1 Tax=Entomortierella parvispora TaxID=205924 RepID=A0A9P3LVX6_9FUNG|nr:metacaspase-1 [Entomortierella parvispora]